MLCRRAATTSSWPTSTARGRRVRARAARRRPLARASCSTSPTSRQVRDVVAAVDAETPLGTVVANAGVAFSARSSTSSRTTYDRLMDVNVRGVFFVVQAAAAGDDAARRGQRRHGLLDVGIHRLDRADDGLRRLEGRRPAPDAGRGPRGRRQRRARQRRRPGHRRDRPHAGPRILRRARGARRDAGPAGPARTARRRSRRPSHFLVLATRRHTSPATSSSSTAAGSPEPLGREEATATATGSLPRLTTRRR